MEHLTTTDVTGATAEAWHADVCIVGAGPAGLVLAHELSSSDLQVLVLEAGAATPPAGGTDVTSTTSTGLPYAPESTRSSGIGGSSLRWSVETPLGPGFVRLKELDAADFEPRDVVAATSWPFGRAELEPHYDRSRELLGIPLSDESRDTRVGALLERRVYSFAPATVFTRSLPELLSRQRNVRVVAGYTVVDIRTDGRSAAATSLICRSETAGPASVTARAFVLAGGGIENARLLLASRSRHPEGLGNHHDVVGRYFMEHPHYVSGVMRRGATPASARWDVVTDGAAVRQDKYALAAPVRQSEGVLDAAYKLKAVRHGPLPFGHDGSVDQETLDTWTSTRALLAGKPREGSVRLGRLGRAAPAMALHAGRRLTSRTLGLLGRPLPARPGYRVMVMAEQEPSPLSRLRLTDTYDRFGVPLAELDWRLTDLDRFSMVHGQALVADDLGAAVGGTVVTTLSSKGVTEPEGGAHHLGTTRMSRSPRSGVVDEDCRVHGVPNLFVAGSSVFPVGGAANPTLTIMALASRLARRIVAELTTPPGLL